ncbi:MAG: XRE family transcriptional regulator [Flavobacteriales bacterium]
MAEKKIHEGRNVKRFREMLGMKQDALAWELGEDWNQKKVSLMEAREQVDEELLSRVADILKIPIEAFKTFDEEQMITIISNTITNSSLEDHTVFGVNHNHQPTFNPLDKLMEAFEEVKRLNAEVISAKEEQIKLLERMLSEK